MSLGFSDVIWSDNILHTYNLMAHLYDEILSLLYYFLIPKKILPGQMR